MELTPAADDSGKGKKRMIEEEKAKTSDVVGEAGEEGKEKADNPLLNLKFSASQSILDDVPRQKVSYMPQNYSLT
jgi:hypothetical protein